MRTLPLALLVAAGCLTELAPAADQPLSLSIAIPPSESGEYHLDPSQAPHFHVILCNRSDTFHPNLSYRPKPAAQN